MRAGIWCWRHPLGQHERFEEAIQHLVDAIKLEPYMAGPRQELASLMQELKGDEAEIRRLRVEEAELLERDAKLASEQCRYSSFDSASFAIC